MSNLDQTREIARLNDAFRQTFPGGQVMLTSGVLAEFSEVEQRAIFKTIGLTHARL